jgi:hypothetical protein
VRVKRDGIWHLGGYWQDLADAEKSLEALLAALPPPARRTATHPSWAAEQARQRAALPKADLSGIYPTSSGWSVKVVRDQVTHYAGHYPTLKEAIRQRDEKLRDLPESVGRGRPPGPAAPKSKRVRQDPAHTCDALL